MIALLVTVPVAYGFIDPDRPIAWLVGECKTIAALKLTAVEQGSATFAVVKVLKGELKDKQLILRWTATQQPPVEKSAVGSPAVLLVPKDAEDPTLIQVSPEYLSVRPDPKQPGQYEFIRLNGFVKGSFNGEAADMLALIEDTLAKRAYFPIWADTSFAAARRIADLPAPASALAVGDLDGDGKLEIVAATGKGLVAFTTDAGGKFTPHPLAGASSTDVPAGGQHGLQASRATQSASAPAVPQTPLQLADLDGDGKLDILTGAGLFLNKGNWQFAGLSLAVGGRLSAGCFGIFPGRATPDVFVVEAGRVMRLGPTPPAQAGAVKSIFFAVSLDDSKGLEGVQAVSACAVGQRLAVLLATADQLVVLEQAANQPLRQLQSIKLTEEGKPGLKNVHLCQRDLDGDGLPDVFLAVDGQARFFRRQADGKLDEVPDYLGDVRKMFTPVAGCAGVLAEDFNNDGLIDLAAWSKSAKLLLVMNRGYHNLREGTDIFDLPAALKDVAEVQAVAAADIDDDGDVDLLVAGDKGLYVLANTFEKKPEEANDRPRNPLLTVRAPGRFGAWVTLEDKDGKALAAQRLGEGPVADTVYFGYRAAPAAVVLTTPDGKTIRWREPATMPALVK